MFARTARISFAFAVLATLSSTVAQGQQLPSPAVAQQLLQSNPALITRLQQMVQSSGMTPEQVRARLRAAGYSESLLDQFLPGGSARSDSVTIPNEDVFAALKTLRITDSLLVDSLSVMARGRRRLAARSDSAFLDTLERAMKNDSTAKAIRSLLRSTELRQQQLDSGFMAFGHELFDAETSQFDANLVGGADPNYRFGPGDVLTLVITGDVEKSYRLTIGREGMVSVPDVGLLSIAGMKRDQLEDLLYRRLGAVYSGVKRGASATTRFYVELGQMGVNQVFVNGDVKRPNAYRVSRSATVMTALYMAGGPTVDGSMRRVQVRRNGETVSTLDVYDYAVRGDASADVRLENGDIVFVGPRGPRVRIAGAVVRPATYELNAGENLGQALQMAGGLTELADQRRLQIERILPLAQRTTSGRDRIVINVPPDRIESTPLIAGDIVRVYQIARRVSSRVTVKGNVWSPGEIGLSPGLSLYDALRLAGGLKPDSYLGDVLITRLHPDSTRSMLRSAVTDTAGNPVNNFQLQDGDEITVFSTTESRPERWITVGGAVRNAGKKIPYREGMTLRDAILLAGGLQEGALMTDVEITRLPETRNRGVTGVPTTVSLDSTFLFERGIDGRVILPPGVTVPSGRTPQIVLLPYDAIQVKWQPEWQLQQTVTIRGEVRLPGDYALIVKTERLSDLIRRAGGLTSSAYPGGIVFVRRRDQIGRIGVDLPAVLEDSRNIDNLQLVDGDSIFIPKYSQVVTVRGAVQSQVGVAYVEGAGVNYYIRSAGGATTKGDEDRAYVTQPNGKVETTRSRLVFFKAHPQPQPGATVVVPEKDPTNRRDWAQIMTATTSILGTLVAIAAIVRR
ncbi:MAG TPA: SLBB domain-containing protein [Gemmatimonadaceae bacterium]